MNILFKDDTVIEQCVKPVVTEPNIYRDSTDGSVNQSNLAVRQGKCISLILYQDAFEIVNPLGSAKTKHKLVGVYFTLGNLSPVHRSKVDYMQLAILCKEKDLKYFGLSKLFSRVIEELKDLEVNGVEVNGVRLPVILAHIAGDNLGQNYIGGFTENFSTVAHMCRFCEISRTQIQDGKILPTVPRTNENLTNSVSRK